MKAKTEKPDSNKELIEALDQIEKEKNISKDILLEAMENSLVAACKNHFGKADNIHVNIDRNTGAVSVYADRTVVDEVEDPVLEISQAEAILRFPNAPTEIGDVVQVEVTPKNFGRIAAQKAKQVVVQKIREEERKVLFNEYFEKEKEVVTEELLDDIKEAAYAISIFWIKHCIFRINSIQCSIKYHK